MCGQPLLLGDEGLTPRPEDALLLKTPRKPYTGKRAADMTDEEAATHLQRMYRARNARRKLRLVLASVFQKVDDGNGNFYYVNTCVHRQQGAQPALPCRASRVPDWKRAGGRDADARVSPVGSVPRRWVSET